MPLVFEFEAVTVMMPKPGEKKAIASCLTEMKGANLENLACQEESF